MLNSAPAASPSSSTTTSRFADRVVKDVPEPAHTPLKHDELFDSKDLPRIDVVQDHFLREGR
jgi:hypothetical protein